MPRRWQVLLVVTAGAFLANLDLFIVNIAFPAIRCRLPAGEPLGAVVGGERLRDRVRGPAGPRRPAGGPPRPQAAVPRGPRRVPGRLRPVRRRPRPVGAHRRPAAPGGGGGAADPHLPRAPAAGVPAVRPRGRGRVLDRGRGRRRDRRPHDRGPAGGAELALGVPGQPPARPDHRGRRRSRCCASRATPDRARVPDLLGALLLAIGVGAARPGHRQGRGVGLDERPGRRRSRSSRSWRSSPSAPARRGTPRPWWRPRCCA